MAYEVFISYSHKDERYRKELGAHLSELRRQGIIADWHDRKITPGADWASEIDTNLNNAQIILLLVSSDFMNSDYCNGIEMKRALERYDAKEALVIPIILRPVYWENAPFARLQVRPKNAKAVSKWVNRDDAYLDIVQGIRMAINELKPASGEKPGEDLSMEQQSIFHVPFLRNPYFTGRDDILERLHNKLTTSKTPQPQAISGLGGIGKTQTAVEYAYRYEDIYDFIFWVKAESRESFNSDFVSIATLLDLPQKQEQEQNRIVEAVKRWFQDNIGWLLIFDNADDLVMVQGFLPSGGKGHILLTTRAHATGRMAQRIEVAKMEPEEGALFLLHRTTLLDANASIEDAPLADQQTAREIVQAMDGLPLALDQAGAYIEETSCGLNGYLQLYQAQGTHLLKERGELVTDHPDPVATTWSLSFKNVEQANAAAAELLRFCAFLASDAIPEELFAESAADLGPTLEPVAADPSRFNAAIKELLKYSLVQRDPESNTLSIHRLVQEVLKDQMDEETQRQWAERAVQAVSGVFSDPEYSNWDHCRRYLLHAQACSALIEQWDLLFTEAATLLNRVGYYLWQRGDYEQVEQLHQRALAIREEALGAEHADTGNSLAHLAFFYSHQRKYEEAEPLIQRALANRERVLGPDHPNTATSLNNLAELYRELGKYEEAEPLYQRALAIRERVLGPDHPNTASSLNNLAALFKSQGKYELAEPLYQRAWAIDEKVYGPDHPEVATDLNNLALLYQAQGKYELAEPLYQRALAIRERRQKP